MFKLSWCSNILQIFQNSSQCSVLMFHLTSWCSNCKILISFVWISQLSWYSKWSAYGYPEVLLSWCFFFPPDVLILLLIFQVVCSGRWDYRPGGDPHWWKRAAVSDALLRRCVKSGRRCAVKSVLERTVIPSMPLCPLQMAPCLPSDLTITLFTSTTCWSEDTSTADIWSAR